MTQSEQLREIVAHYQEATGRSIYQTHEVAEWAIRHRLWREHPAAMVDRCATALARALREDRLADGVRAKHAVRIVQGGLQLTLWADMRTAGREHMKLAFEQRRTQIRADCQQLQNDLAYYNRHHNPGPAIQLSLDFTDDMLEPA